MTALAAERGLILLACGVYGNVIRILVPLTAEPAIVDEGLDILAGCLGDARRLSPLPAPAGPVSPTRPTGAASSAKQH